MKYLYIKSMPASRPDSSMMHLVSCMAGGAEQCSGTGEELGDRCESEHVHLGVSALKQVHISAASLPLYLPACACADTWSCKNAVAYL